jgi:uncharacterized membrane protein
MWIYLSLGSAFFESLSDASSKIIAQKMDILLFLPIWWFFDGTFTFSPQFWNYTLTSIALNIVASLVYMRAIRDTDLSLCLPLLKLSPLWTLITAPIINGDYIGIFGTSGIFLMVLGTYGSNFSKRKEGLFKPFTVIWSNKGMREMLFVSIIWSIAAPCDRMAILASSPLFFLIAINFGLLVAFSLIMLRRRSSRFVWSIGNCYAILWRGLCSVSANSCQMYAFAAAPVPLVVSVKRLSLLFGLMWGKLLFRENNLGERTIGAVITLLGILLVVLEQN